MIEEQPAIERQPGGWEQYRFLLLVGGAVIVAGFLVGVALALYASSGAAQLDLSRPGYQSVRDQVGQSSTFDGYPATGPLDAAALDEFRRLYDDRASQATSIDSFGGAVMTDDNLSIDPPAANE